MNSYTNAQLRATVFKSRPSIFFEDFTRGITFASKSEFRVPETAREQFESVAKALFGFHPDQFESVAKALFGFQINLSRWP